MCCPEEGRCEKDVRSKVTANKWLWWWANGLIDNLDDFVLPSPCFTREFMGPGAH